MKAKSITGYILLALPFFVAACEKGTDFKEQGSGHFITVGVDIDETRGLMRPADLTKSGTQAELTIYGYDGTDTPVFDGLTATPPTQSSQPGTISLVNWTIKKNNTELKPEWDDSKDYSFLSWTQQDASGKKATDLFTAGFSYTAAKASTSATEGDVPAQLAIASTKLPIDAGIMDFCYSDAVTRKAGDRNYSIVQMNLKHLFSAFTVSAHNYSASSIKITSIVLNGIHNNKSAEITFNTTEKVGSKAVYTSQTDVTNEELVTETGGITITSENSMANVAKGSSNDPKYFLMWPQTASEFTSSTPQLVVTYSIAGGSSKTATLDIPNVEGDGWPAGICQNLEISFAEKSMYLTVKPMPWNQIEPIYDYQGAVSVSGQLSFPTTSKYIISPAGSKNVFFDGSNPIILEFKIDTPENASWMVEKIGDFDAFEIDNVTPGIGTGASGDGIDTKEGVINGDVARIAIYPKITDPQKDYKIQLSFTVRGTDGTVTKINNGIQGTDNTEQWYTFYILK